MCIVLCEPADALQTVESSRFFVSVNRAEFSPSEREFTIAPFFSLVEHYVERAVHRFYVIIFTVYIHRIVHSVFIESEVSARFPKKASSDVRSENQVISVSYVLFSPEILDNCSDYAAVRSPKNESAADIFGESEKIKVCTDLSVVSLFRLFEHLEIFVELLFGPERRSVDPLEHLSLFVTAPVCACDRHKFVSLYETGVRNVWTAAKINKIAVIIKRNSRFAKIFNDLNFEILAFFCEKFYRFILRNDLSYEGMFCLDDLAHLLFDSFKIINRETVLRIKIVIKTVLYRRTDRYFRAREKLLDSISHDVRSRMADYRKPLFAFRGDYRHIAGFDFSSNIDELVVYRNCYRRFGKAFAYYTLYER